MLAPAAVLTDIEGTTTPPAFIQGVLLPYARQALPDWASRIDLPDVATILGEIRRMVPDQPELTTLQHWSDRDLKLAPLQRLQGMIWEQGYADGDLRGQLYPDVPPHLHAWTAQGIRIFTYTSGSIPAQKLIFGHSTAGDLSPLIAGFFDTRIGAKRDPDSYVRLAIGMNVPTSAVAFLSDNESELDAATTAGMRTCHIVRPDTATTPSDRHPTATTCAEAASLLGLPRVG
jgi:enolase-phosphatase E1